MAKKLALSLTFILLLAFSVSAKFAVDTIDNWHVSYNTRLIARYTEVDENLPISIKASGIKPGDMLTVNYFCDAPDGKAKTGLYFFDNKNHKLILARGTGTFSPLKIALTDVLDNVKRLNRNYLDFYYFDGRRDHLIFRLKME